MLQSKNKMKLTTKSLLLACKYGSVPVPPLTGISSKNENNDKLGSQVMHKNDFSQFHLTSGGSSPPQNMRKSIIVQPTILTIGENHGHQLLLGPGTRKKRKIS